MHTILLIKSQLIFIKIIEIKEEFNNVIWQTSSFYRLVSTIHRFYISQMLQPIYIC